MRRFLIAYGIWNRADMVGTICFGVHRGTPAGRVETLFVFDHCKDDSALQHARYARNVLECHGPLPPIELAEGEHDEVPIHNHALRVMMERGLDAAIVFQEDQIMVPGRDLIAHVDRLLDTYGDKLGVVGGRDGFGHGCTEMVGSAWSVSSLQRRLAPGEFAARPLSNRGPVIYPRKLVETVGVVDPLNEYDVWFTEIDYCNRAHRAGFVNGVMGTDLTDWRWGQGVATDHYNPGRHLRDLETMKRKWPDLHQ